MKTVYHIKIFIICSIKLFFTYNIIKNINSRYFYNNTLICKKFVIKEVDLLLSLKIEMRMKFAH